MFILTITATDSTILSQGVYSTREKAQAAFLKFVNDDINEFNKIAAEDETLSEILNQVALYPDFAAAAANYEDAEQLIIEVELDADLSPDT